MTRLSDSVKRACEYEGCDVTVTNRLGFCRAHYAVAHECSFSAECRYRCAAHSRSMLCQEHAWYAGKLREAQLPEE